MTEPRIAVYSGNKAVYPDMAASAKSMIANDGADKIIFLTEDDRFPEELPEMVENRNVSGQTYISESSPNRRTNYSYFTALRVAYPMMFKEYSRILTIDVDTIVCGNMDGIWSTYLDDAYYAGVEEHGYTVLARVGQTGYYNWGVILMNLEKMRENGFCEKMLERINTERYAWIEQDLFSKSCAGYTRSLPIRYNYAKNMLNQPDIAEEDIVIRHYAAENYRSYREKALWQKWNGTSWEEALKMNRELKAEKHGKEDIDAEPERNGAGADVAAKQNG